MIIAFHRCRHCEVWQLPSQMIVPGIDGALCLTCAESIVSNSPARAGVIVQFQTKVQHG